MKIVYGRLLEMVEKAFAKDKPLFSLAMYYPLAYAKKPTDNPDVKESFDINRQKQLVRLIRILFLKRFESSAFAFQTSCQELLLKMLAFVTKNSNTESEKKRLERWLGQHAELIGYVKEKQLEMFDNKPDEDSEDIITPGMLKDVDQLSIEDYDVDEIIQETYLDMDEIVRFLEELKQFKPTNDDKLKALAKILKTDPVLSKQKLFP